MPCLHYILAFPRRKQQIVKEDIKLPRRLLLEELRRISFRDKNINKKMIDYVYSASNINKSNIEEEVELKIKRVTKKFITHIHERYQK